MEKKISIKSILMNMKVGEEREFPAEKLRSVAVSCSDYNFITGSKFVVRKDWERRKVIVKRES